MAAPRLTSVKLTKEGLWSFDQQTENTEEKVCIYRESQLQAQRCLLNLYDYVYIHVGISVADASAKNAIDLSTA